MSLALENPIFQVLEVQSHDHLPNDTMSFSGQSALQTPKVNGSRVQVLYFKNTEALDVRANFGVGKNILSIILDCASHVHPTCECMFSCADVWLKSPVVCVCRTSQIELKCVNL